MSARSSSLAFDTIHADMNVATHPIRLLVLDDDLFDRKRLKHLSKKFGVRTIISEAETLDMLRTELDATRFDAILIDYRLGANTGMEALEIIQKHPGNASAAKIMLSGEDQLDFAVAAIKQGCDDYLSKSGLSVEALYASISAAMSKTSHT